MEPSGRRWPKRTVLIATVLVTLAIGCLPFVSPAVAAYACPSCYGLQRVTGSLFVDPAMSVEDRTKLQEVVALAAVQVADFYGSFDHLLAHEFSHVELHAQIGVFRLLMGAIPAWFDEGLAVIVADDPRYLRPGATSATRCSAEPGGDLPSSPFKWGRRPARHPTSMRKRPAA